MATLEKIRSKGLLLLIVVGLALVVFIVGDLVNSGSTYFQENNANVAVINGDKVKIRDYAEKMDQFNDVVKMQYGNNITDEMMEQIRQMVWESTVTEKIVGDDCAKIGMMVTKNELVDMLVGNNISPMMMSTQMFFNQNGQFDVNIVKQFICSIAKMLHKTYLMNNFVSIATTGAIGNTQSKLAVFKKNTQTYSMQL